MLHRADIFVDILVIGVASYFLFDLIRSYKSAAGNFWQRTLGAAKGAAGSLWTGFTVGVTLVAQGVAHIATLVNAPSVATAITTYLEPKVVAGIMVATALIIEIANRHKPSA
jgi:hypothetical protein